MTLNDVKDHLKARIERCGWYLEKIDANQEYCIGVFSTRSPEPVIPMGGIRNSAYADLAVSILVHWGRSSTPAREKAQEVFDLLFGRELVIGQRRVVKIDFRTSRPQGIGTDDKGIYEYVINFVIYYDKKGID